MSKHKHLIQSQKDKAELLCPWCTSIVHVHPSMFFKTENRALSVLCTNCTRTFYASVIYLTNIDEKRIQNTIGVAIKAVHDYDEKSKTPD